MSVLQEVLSMTNQLPNAREEFFLKYRENDVCYNLRQSKYIPNAREEFFEKKIVKTTCVTTHIN